MRLPVVFAPLLRERAVCLALLGTCMGLVIANAFGISLWKCAFRETTGLPCPGCGMTRGMSALVRGHWRDALHFHPFAPLFAIAAAIMLLSGVLPEAKRIRLVEGIGWLERKTGFAFLTLMALMAYGLWRMFHGPYV